MSRSPLAGQPAPTELLIDPARLKREFFERKPDVGNPDQLVSFGTSGHRGTPGKGTFTELHILAIAQAICDYRSGKGIDVAYARRVPTQQPTESRATWPREIMPTLP